MTLYWNYCMQMDAFSFDVLMTTGCKGVKRIIWSMLGGVLACT